MYSIRHWEKQEPKPWESMSLTEKVTRMEGRDPKTRRGLSYEEARKHFTELVVDSSRVEFVDPHGRVIFRWCENMPIGSSLVGPDYWYDPEFSSYFNPNPNRSETDKWLMN